MGKAPFSELFLQAWKASSPKTVTLAFGLLVAAGAASEQLALQAFWQPAPESLAAVLRGAWSEYAAFVSLVFVMMLLMHAFGQANLIAALSENKKMRFQRTDMVSRGVKALAVDAVAAGVLGVLALVFAAPPLMALSANRGAFEGATLLSVFAFLPVLLAVLFIRQYGLFYYVLSALRFRSAVDQGATLFSKFIARSLMFWIFSFAIAAVFTFFLNAAMLGTSSLCIKAGLEAFSSEAALAIGFAGFIWFTIFDQALSLRFFEDLASEKDVEKLVSGEQRVFDPGMPVA